MCRVLNKHKTGVPSGAVFIGRGSKWGNPFHIGAKAIGPPSSRNTKAGCATSIICCGR